MDPLNKVNSVLPQARKDAIKSIIADAIKRNEIQRTNDVTIELDKLTSQVSSLDSESVFKIREAIAGERISSEDWNDTQKEAFIDLRSIYEEIKLVNSLATKHNEINQSELRQSKTAIIKAITDIRKYQFLKQFQDYQDIKYVDFSDGRNTSFSRPLAHIDTQTHKLELPSRTRRRLQQSKIDLASTEVSYRVLGGGIQNGLDESFSPEMMLDDNPNTFWAELVMTDGVVTQNYSPSGDGGLGTNFRSDGLIVEVELTLSNTQRINNISLLPFSAYPLRIIDLAYKESPFVSHWTKVPSFTVEDPSLNWHEWSFSPIFCSVLRVTLEQVNFTTNIIHLPEELVNNHALWSQISNKLFDQSIHNLEIDEILSGKISAQPNQLAYLDALKKVDNELKQYAFTIDQSSDEYKVVERLVEASGNILTKINPQSLNSVITPLGGHKNTDDDVKIVEIRKNEYIFGIRSIDMSNILYSPVARYSSPKFNSNATILEVSIESEESHPEFTDNFSTYHKTNIEYELELGENIRFPIIPSNYEKITGETGSIGGYQIHDEFIGVDRTTLQGHTRHIPASFSAIVRRNGIRIPSSDYTFNTDTSNNLGLLSVTNNYDPNAIYTMSYVADNSGSFVNVNDRFNSTELQVPDKFIQTNRNNAIKLTYFPYIEYDIVNNTTGWIRDDINDAKWRFNPTLPNYKDGTVSIHSGSLIVTGIGTDFTGNITTGTTNVFRLKGDTNMYPISSVLSATGLQLETAYESGSASGEYQVGESFIADNVTYALDQNMYEPIKISVNDIKAFNLTDYRTLEHPAFVPDERFGRQYQYIHAGQIIYFNKAIQNSQIEATYSWLTQYIKINMTLRCNIPIRTNVTPKVDNFFIKIKNSKL